MLKCATQQKLNSSTTAGYIIIQLIFIGNAKDIMTVPKTPLHGMWATKKLPLRIAILEKSLTLKLFLS